MATNYKVGRFYNSTEMLVIIGLTSLFDRQTNTVLALCEIGISKYIRTHVCDGLLSLDCIMKCPIIVYAYVYA